MLNLFHTKIFLLTFDILIFKLQYQVNLQNYKWNTLEIQFSKLKRVEVRCKKGKKV
jgi:hypothetical protein